MVRVAQDISFLVEQHIGGHGMTGITRAVVETHDHLGRDPRLQMSVSTLCAHDPPGAWVSLHDVRMGNLAQPHERYANRLPVAFHRNVYRRLRSSGVGGGTGRRGLLRLAWGGLKAMDLGSHEVGSLDVFHSTFLPLPQPDVTAGAARVLSIWDVIPLTDPVVRCHDDLRNQMTVIIDSLRPEDHVIVNSHFVANELARLRGVGNDRLTVVPLAADERYADWTAEGVLAARAAVGLGDRRYVLSVASLQNRKNLPLLLRAFARLVETDAGAADTDLVLVGAPWLDADQINAVRNEHTDLGDRIHFVGHVTEPVLVGLYGGAAVFVFPSRAEGFGLPLVEAMKAGLPVIAADASASPEVLGGAGVLVDVDDVDGLASHLAWVLGDPERSRMMRTQSRERAREFSWEGTAARTAEVYLRLASRN